MQRLAGNGVVTVLLGVLALQALSTSASASGATTVYPTGIAGADVANVQAALDVGGTVLLKATNTTGQPTAFDFGPSSRAGKWVTIDVDVTLLGETTTAGATTIRGGWGPITIENGANATVTGLSFDHPFWLAITAFFAGSLRLTHNRIEHVVGQPRSSGVTDGEGIDAGFSAGDVVINDNVIDDVDAEFGEGIGEYGASGTVEIARNRITGVNLAGIEVTSYTFLPGQGVTVHDNYVRPGQARYARGSAGTGIELNGHGSYDVQRNEVMCENPNAACIFAFGFQSFGFGSVQGARIAHNTITLTTDPFGAVGVVLIGQVSHAVVAQNKISGTGFAALATFGCACEPASLLDLDTFIGNEIATMHSGFADVYFESPTHAATVVGRSGTVFDQGTDDLITGFTAVGGGGASIGSRLSDAIASQQSTLAGPFSVTLGSRTR